MHGYLFRYIVVKKTYLIFGIKPHLKLLNLHV